MIPTGYYVGKEEKLLHQLAKTLNRFAPKLDAAFGSVKSRHIRDDAVRLFGELIPRIPYYRTTSYQHIILVNAQLVAIIRAAAGHNIPALDILKIQTALFKEDYRTMPRLAGQLFTSGPGQFFLKKLAGKLTREHWDTEVISGGPGDDFDVSVRTTRCGVVEYLKAEGMTEVLPYCNMSDFLMFPAMGIGLKQTSTIDAGACVYCKKYGGPTEVPASLTDIYTAPLQAAR